MKPFDTSDHSTAMLYTFLGTCKINDVNPFEWLRDVLGLIPIFPVNN